MPAYSRVTLPPQAFRFTPHPKGTSMLLAPLCGIALALACLAAAPAGATEAADVPAGTPNDRLSAAAADSPTWDGITDYREQQLEGWRVLVNRKLLAEKELCAATLALLEQQLRQITSAVPEQPLIRLREIPIWVERSSSQFPCMCYHESRAWLETHGVNPAKTGAVELANPTNFLTWTRQQPWMVLHELAHGYHQRFLGENHAGIEHCYEQAKASGRYQSVLRNNGRHEPHYALSNAKEYFAEMTEAFFGTNDFYPFVRAELRDYDAPMFAVLGEVWGMTNVLAHEDGDRLGPRARGGVAGYASTSRSVQAAEATASAHRFGIGTNTFELDGRPFQIRCGELHAARVPREYWQHRLRMTRAMGLNTVCAYLFWNLVEPRPGEFVWTGQADAAEFCRIAQQEGLWVILRPGPYACAEWEMGGLPWWLLKEPDTKLRTRDPRYLAAVRAYLKEMGRVLGPLQVTQGGPILMVQVENEYGFYGKDVAYMGELRQMLLDAGFYVPLFCCNPPSTLKNGYRADLFPVVNFGSDPAGGFRALREILPQGPLMCGEFYPGWFDTWGAPHHKGNTGTYLADLKAMLQSGASFSIYMAHGGTTFGLWSGADRPFKPDTSSYDYDAPISEAGWPTEKFYQTRRLLSEYLLPGETLPEPPATNPVVAFASVRAGEAAPLFANLPAPVADLRPRSMEQYDQGYGWILYRTTLPAGPAVTLEATEVHDFGYVFLDGQRRGVMDRRNHSFKSHLPHRAQPARLDILVEPMGRVNFGPEVHDRKGLLGPVRVAAGTGQGRELTGWQVFSLPLDAGMLSGLRFSNAATSGPAFWRAHLDLKQPGDTFLDMRPWGKGVVWVNGHCLGRFWNIGPTQTMYLPGAWLRAGQNDILIADLLGPEQPIVAGLSKPILDQLRPELNFMRSQRPEVRLNLTSAAPVREGQFEPGTQQQNIAFDASVRGRYFCLESLSAHDGKPYAAVAELNLLDEHGQPLSHADWGIAYVDSEEREREDGSAENAIDGQVANFWHTQWGSRSPGQPHRLVLDLGQSRLISGFQYVPRQGAGSVGGRIKEYRVYVGDRLVEAPK